MLDFIEDFKVIDRITGHLNIQFLAALSTLRIGKREGEF